MRRIYLGIMFCLAAFAAILAACGSGGEPSAPAVDIPATISTAGDIAKGQLFYEGEGGCIACHSITTVQQVGPGLAGAMTSVGPVHPAGVDYGGNLPNGQARTEENIAAWIRSGGEGKVGVMSGREVSDEDMADLLAYLRTLK